MDPEQADADKKLQFLRGYIEKQFATGRTPKAVYADLVDRKVPPRLASEMITSVLDAETPPAIPQSSPAEKQPEPTASPEDLTPASQPDSRVRQESPPPDRSTRIKIYIRSQLAAGRSEKEILALLLQRQVSRSLALDLIHEVFEEPVSEAVTPMPRAAMDVAPELRSAPSAIAIPPLDNLRAISEYVHSQLALGIGQKELVDRLEAHGMPRSQAIDVVVAAGERNQRQKAGAADGGLREKRQRAGRKLLIGAAFLTGGGCITLVSFMAAEEGGTYWLFYGPMIYGLVSLVSGVVDWVGSR
jgi:hypothetical protein